MKTALKKDNSIEDNLMKRIGKFLRVEKHGEIFLVFANDGAALGQINHFPQWKQYVFEPEIYTIYSAGCLKDLAKFLESLG